METGLVQESSKFDMYLVQKQVEVLIDIKNSRIMNEMAKINSAVESLKEEINDVRKYLSDIVRKVEENRAMPQQVPLSAGQPATESQGNALNPRLGNYKSGDVSVFKFFYNGNKPR